MKKLYSDEVELANTRNTFFQTVKNVNIPEKFADNYLPQETRL